MVSDLSRGVPQGYPTGVGASKEAAGYQRGIPRGSGPPREGEVVTDDAVRCGAVCVCVWRRGKEGRGERRPHFLFLASITITPHLCL